MERSEINSKMWKVSSSCPDRNVGIALLGEAPGENEAIKGEPFIGSAGRLLDGLLKVSGIDRSSCWVGNVFSERPPGNSVDFFFKKKGILKEEWQHELARLQDELTELAPNIVIAMGATALWAMTGLQGISKQRGTILESTLVPGLKVLPTYHPAFVLRQWQYRPTVGKDFMKALIESKSSTIIRPERELWIRPTLEDLYEFDRYMQVKRVAADIETSYPFTTLRQILCVGFAPSPSMAIVVPFVDKTKKNWSYWETLDEECEALEWCAKHLTSAKAKIGQNFLYDVQWLDKMFGIKVRGRIDDTMFMAHALQPELEKSLGYLSSMYTNEASFKTMVSFTKNKGDS